MLLYRRIYLLLFALFVLSGTVYYMGCSSAETTTGKLAFQQKDFEKAESELKKGLIINPGDDEAWYFLGYSQVELGKYEEAQTSFKKCLAISPTYGEMIVSLWIGKFNDGAREFKNGIDAEEKKNPSGAKSFYEAALKSFTASSYIIPDSLKSFSAMGEVYLALGDQKKALEIFKTISVKSNSKEDAEKAAKIIFNSGINIMALKDYKVAYETFSEVLTISALPKNDPYYETAQYNCGLALAKMGEDMRTNDEKSDYKEKFNKALTYLEPLTQNLTKKDLEPQLYELLVSVYANLGMTDKAKDALQKKDSLKKN